MARLLDQQETLPLWQEKAQVSLYLSIRWGSPAGSSCFFFQRLGASGRRSPGESEFSAHILAFDGYFLHAYYVLGPEDRAVSWEQVLLFQKMVVKYT